MIEECTMTVPARVVRGCRRMCTSSRTLHQILQLNPTIKIKGQLVSSRTCQWQTQSRRRSRSCWAVHSSRRCTSGWSTLGQCTYCLQVGSDVFSDCCPEPERAPFVHAGAVSTEYKTCSATMLLLQRPVEGVMHAHCLQGPPPASWSSPTLRRRSTCSGPQTTRSGRCMTRAWLLR
jgi:hypothetical protein